MNVETILTRNSDKTFLYTVLSRLHQADYHFRLEDDEDGYYFSIINRKVYPRIWSDNFHDNEKSIIAETTNNIINRTILPENDWSERWFGESVESVLYQAYEWMSIKNIA